MEVKNLIWYLDLLMLSFHFPFEWHVLLCNVWVFLCFQVPLLNDTEDDTIAFGDEDDINSSNYRSYKFSTFSFILRPVQKWGCLLRLVSVHRHPYVIFFHLAFRSAALATYIFGTSFSNSFIAIFVTMILLLSMDFWTIKNITGESSAHMCIMFHY